MGLLTFTFTGEVVAMPKMTQRDRWKKRPVVMRFRNFKDHLYYTALEAGYEPLNHEIYYVAWTLYLPIPKSWTKKKKLAMKGQPHQQKPDRDNIDKGICDALSQKDEVIWRGRQKKLWDDGKGPRLEIMIAYKILERSD